MKIENIFSSNRIILSYGKSPYKIKTLFLYKRTCKFCNKIRYNTQNQGNFCNSKCKQRFYALKKQKTLNPKEHAKCEICGYLAKDLTKHIYNWHKISVKEYLDIYPNSNVMYKDLKEKRHEIASKSMTEYNKNHGSWNKGLTKNMDKRLEKAGKNISKAKNTKEWRENNKEFLNNIGKCNKNKTPWNKNLTKDNCEIINKVSEKFKGRKFNDDWKENIKKGKDNFKKNNPIRYKEMCKKLSISSARNNGNKSKKEWIIKYFLDSLNINFLHGKELFGFQPDFYFPELNKIIEVNGCYWHGCDMCNPEVKLNPGKHYRANLTIHNYDKKMKIFKEHDLVVMEIWEHEFDKGNITNDVKKKIVRFLS